MDAQGLEPWTRWLRVSLYSFKIHYLNRKHLNSSHRELNRLQPKRKTEIRALHSTKRPRPERPAGGFSGRSDDAQAASWTAIMVSLRRHEGSSIDLTSQFNWRPDGNIAGPRRPARDIAQALPARSRDPREQQDVRPSLMVPFTMVVWNMLADRPTQRAFSEENDLRQTFLLSKGATVSVDEGAANGTRHSLLTNSVGRGTDCQ